MSAREDDNRLLGAAILQLRQQPRNPERTKLGRNLLVATAQSGDEQRPRRIGSAGWVGEQCRLCRRCFDQGVGPWSGLVVLDLAQRQENGPLDAVAAQSLGQCARILFGQAGGPLVEHHHDRAGRIVADGLLELRTPGHARAEVRRAEDSCLFGRGVQHVKTSARRPGHDDQWPAVAGLRGEPAGVHCGHQNWS